MIGEKGLTGCESVPLSIYDTLRRGCAENPNKVVGVDEQGFLTYAQALKLSQELASRLCDLGVKAGDAVLFCFDNCAAYPAFTAACELVGARIVLSAPGVSEEEIKRRVRLVSPVVCIVNQDFEYLEALHDLGVAVLRETSEPDPERSGFVEQQGLRHAQASEVVVFTSGSTGLPKAVLCDMASFTHNANCMNSSYEAARGDAFFVPLPFSHVFGFLGMCAALRASATLVTLRRYTPKAALEIVGRTGASIQYGASTMLIRQLKEAKADAVGTSSLKTFVLGGDSCPADVMDAFEQRFACKVVQSWGMSEAASTLTAMSRNADAALRHASVGAGIEGVEIMQDPQTGELLCRAATLAKATIDETGEKPLLKDADGWFATGDLGTVDADGMVYIRGRLKDVVVRGGMNIYPAEVERLYRERPDVADCCLVGFPDDELGQRTCLCVVLANGTEQEDPLELREWARGRIEKCRIPDAVLPLDSFSLLPNGKVDKQAIKRRACDWAKQSFRQVKR